MGNHREKKLGPLAFGYTEIGITHMKMQWKLLLQVDYSNVIGMNLVNFAFTNEVALAEVMTQMYALYLEAKRHKDENAFIAMVLIEQYMPLLEQNYYVSVYLMWYIEFLLQGEVDPRVFTKIVGIDKELFQLLVVQDDPEAVEILKYKLIPSICRCYEAKKGLVEVTLKAVWEEHQTDGLEPLERYYKYEQEEPFFRKHWNSAFTVKLGKRDEKTGDVIQLTELGTVDDMLRYDMLQLLTKGNYKICKNCGMPFIPVGRADSLYCNRIMPGWTKPCNKIGANLAAKKKVNSNPALKIYRQAYQRMNKRMEQGYLEREAYDSWVTEAAEKRDQCLAGELSYKKFADWIDATSRRR